MTRHVRPWCFAVALSGCAIPGIEPTPFLGIPPRSLLVAPVVNLSGQPGLEAAFVAGAAVQLTDRGYYVYPTDTGLSLLRGQEPTTENLVMTGRELHLDGVLVITVTSWYAVFDRVLETLSFDVSYRILSTIDGQVIWEHEAVDSYHREREPIRVDDPYLGPAFEPGAPDYSESFRFRDNVSVASALSRTVFLHLPEAPATR